MNGSMIPYPDKSITVTKSGDDYLLHSKTNEIILDEKYDHNLLLTEAQVLSKDMDATAYPTYMDTPQGRIVSAIRTVFRQPPTAPPAEVLISVSYAKVGSFQLPESLHYEIKNIGSFEFTLDNCSVTTDTSDKAEKP
jgi:hypothetical protein